MWKMHYRDFLPLETFWKSAELMGVEAVEGTAALDGLGRQWIPQWYKANPGVKRGVKGRARALIRTDPALLEMGYHIQYDPSKPVNYSTKNPKTYNPKPQSVATPS